MILFHLLTLLIIQTHSRNPAEDIAYCQSPEASTVTSSSMSLEQTGEETKIMLWERKKYARPMQEARWRRKRRKERERCRIEFGQEGQQKRQKIQDKFYAQESSYSLIAAVSKVIDLNMLKTKYHLSFPHEMMEKQKKNKRKKVGFVTQHSQPQDRPNISPHSNWAAPSVQKNCKNFIRTAPFDKFEILSSASFIFLPFVQRLMVALCLILGLLKFRKMEILFSWRPQSIMKFQIASSFDEVYG